VCGGGGGGVWLGGLFVVGADTGGESNIFKILNSASRKGRRQKIIEG